MTNWIHEVLDALDQQEAESIDRRIRASFGRRKRDNRNNNDESMEADTNSAG